VVSLSQSVKDGKYVAIKCMKATFSSLEQVNNLREVQALRRLSPHPHIVKLIEVLLCVACAVRFAVGLEGPVIMSAAFWVRLCSDQPTGRLALVFELLEYNIYEMIKGKRQYLPEGQVKGLMYQLMKSMDHMHKYACLCRNGVFHRDIKPENILVADGRLKLADFGSCRGIYSKQVWRAPVHGPRAGNFHFLRLVQPYTEYISTRWYRAPECLLTDGYYGHKMDIWGVGCVMFEVLALFPLFPGSDETDQIARIHKIMGTPPPSVRLLFRGVLAVLAASVTRVCGWFPSVVPRQLLEKFRKHSNHVDFSAFRESKGTGIARMLPHVSKDAVDLIEKLLIYDPEERCVLV
jgi:renal tumor antigen